MIEIVEEKIKELYKPLGSTCNIYPLLSICRFCGNLWICNLSIPCPCCDSSDICIVPIKDHPKFNLKWLSNHGFGYIEKRLEVGCIVR